MTAQEEHPLTPFALIAAVYAVGFTVRWLLKRKGWM